MFEPAPFLKKVIDLRKLLCDKSKDRNAITQAIDDLIMWLHDDRRLRYHRCMFAFFQYCWESDDSQPAFDTLDDYLDNIKLMVGHCKKKRVEVGGQVVIYCIPGSISFGKCPQKKFELFCDNAKHYIERMQGIHFAEWKIEFGGEYNV